MPAPVLLSAVTRGAVEFTRTPTLALAVAVGRELEAYLAFAAFSDNSPLTRPAKSVICHQIQLRPDVPCLSSGCTTPGGARVPSS